MAYVSGAEVPGEGELKLFAFLNRQPIDDARNSSALVVSGDSDVLLFSLMSSFRGIEMLRLGGKGSEFVYSIDAMRQEIAELFDVTYVVVCCCCCERISCL
jgi:hypothetical protein